MKVAHTNSWWPITTSRVLIGRERNSKLRARYGNETCIRPLYLFSLKLAGAHTIVLNVIPTEG